MALPGAQTTPDLGVVLRDAAARYATGEYGDALTGFTQAEQSPDTVIALAALKGVVRTAVRLGEFTLARRAADRLVSEASNDAEALALVGDAQWSAGFFDEADQAYDQALAIETDSPRALFGRARSLGSRSRLPEALATIERAVEASPDDVDLRALVGTVLERLNRFEDAARAYRAYAERLPSRDSVARTTALGRADFLRGFSGRTPLDVSEADLRRPHTMPFKLVSNKILVQGRLNGVQVEWVLDTGAERTGVSPDVAAAARIRPTSTTLTAGVGRPSLRRIRLGRADLVEIGTLGVRNVPLSIRSPAAGGPPRWQGQSLSPLALGFSLSVDYGRKRLTLARTLPEEPVVGKTLPLPQRLPLRVQRLPLVRGTLNSIHAAYFVVDTGGEVISIGADTADLLGMMPGRRIPLRVLGMSGADADAFLLPGVNLEFAGVSLERVGLAVLNLKAPSLLLGFQVGGIVGHGFLSRYHVSIDVPRSEVRLVSAGS